MQHKYFAIPNGFFFDESVISECVRGANTSLYELFQVLLVVVSHY